MMRDLNVLPAVPCVFPVVAIWPKLPEHIKVVMKALVRITEDGKGFIKLGTHRGDSCTMSGGAAEGG